MPLITQRIVRGLTPFLDPYLTPALRTRPEKIILGVKPGHRPSDKPPVRIFLGSERKQFRAERTFIWSVEAHRDPSRIYEIHVLKGLKGWISGFWITGFTNYRFAIPYFCEYRGRAIYNDVDQVWLTDPAELFDRDMGAAGFLSINDRDTSVMLIDCERMAPVWNRESVHRTTRKRIEARARQAGLWGEMPGRFNARDAEYVPGESACVHFTTLHTQPWRPFPDWFVYHANPTGALWFDLERAADRAGYLPVNALRPSSAWPDTALALSSRRDGPELATLLGARKDAVPPAGHRQLDDLLERVPDADLPWVLERLFSSSRTLDLVVREPLWIRRKRPRRSLHFWVEQLQLAGRLHPATRWRLQRRVGPIRRSLAGGPLQPGAIVVLADASDPMLDAETLARALGRTLGADDYPVVVTTDRAGFIAQAGQAAVLIAKGAAAVRAARQIARRADRPPAVVLLGRHAASVPEHRGVAINPEHAGLPPHPNRLTTVAGFGPQGEISATPPDGERRAALLIGRAPTGRWRDSDLRALVQRARDWAAARDASLLIVAGSGALDSSAMLRDAAGADTPVVTVDTTAESVPNLGTCNAVLLAGIDPVLLRAALASARPLYLAPIDPDRGWIATLRRRIAERAFRPRYNKRGSIRPQQGLTYLCARLIERGRVRPPDDPAELQRLLVGRGLAAWIGDDAVPSRRWHDELDDLVAGIVERLAPDGADHRVVGRGHRSA